jgi:hypothetical protein
MLIFSHNFFRSARRSMGEDLLFTLTTQDRTPPENAELLVKKIVSASPHTDRAHLISHHPTSFFSDL